MISITKNKAFLNLKFSLANAYPARDAKITCPNVVIDATIWPNLLIDESDCLKNILKAGFA